jgi:hypothetical protein
VASYYPPRIATIKQLRSLYPQHEIIDEDEEDWLEHHNVARSRGKGTPKKKRTAAGKSMWDNMYGWVLTAGRIQEVQQAQVSERNAAARLPTGLRACIRTVNEALGGVMFGWHRFGTQLRCYIQNHHTKFPASSTTICFWYLPRSSSTASRTRHPTALALSYALAVLEH